MEGACITSRTFSRVGLLGNPSDGYQGKTISVSCANFWAEVHSRVLLTQVATAYDPCVFVGQVSFLVCSVIGDRRCI